jgi:Transcription factor WhiB
MTTATARFNTALITMAVRGDRPRCSDPVDHAMWTSEDQQDRAIAATWCTGCEVLDLCAEVAVEEDHRWGVWGSRDFSHRPGTKKRKQAALAL